MKLIQLKQNFDTLMTEKSQLTINAMAKIQPEVDRLNGELKKLQAEIEVTVNRFVSDARRKADKMTGVINVEADGVKIKHSQAKSISWDQIILEGIADDIRAAGDDPSEYMNTVLSIEERKYSAWPKIIQKKFLPARTERPGKPSYQITIPTVKTPCLQGK